ncbi:hypothetical protein [Streptomyces sp. bgisy034]
MLQREGDRLDGQLLGAKEWVPADAGREAEGSRITGDGSARARVKALIR